ncbi:MAG: DUF1643 domain-containing protein [Desulfobulbus sp.]|nr:DUF1643 domain-containing protein [Desulfobulbus sp.]
MPKSSTAIIGSPAPPPSRSVDPLIVERTIFNADRTHRFTLFRYWGNPDDYACGISMNPSGAAEDVGDPTVDGMVRRAREYWGVGAYYQLNVMSIRSTYSSDLATTAVVNCVFRKKTASVPAGKRPPFRWENGRRSDWNAAAIPVKTASTN